MDTGEAMTAQEWEKYHKDEDLKLQKQVRKLNGKSTRRLYAGALMFMLLAAHFGATVNQAGEALENASPEMGSAVVHDILDSGFFLSLLAMAVIGLILLLRSAALWNRSEDISNMRFIWMPTEEEKKDIEARFDNDFVRFIMSKVSLRDTESIKVSLDGINIRNNTGDKHCNLNKSGFKRLTNYETKQLAYYIADKMFTEGFTIIQSKKYETVYERYVGGVTEVGGEAPKKKSLMKMAARDVRWLSGRISEIMRIKNPLGPERQTAGPDLLEGGQIILNKGYRPDDSKFKTL